MMESGISSLLNFNDPNTGIGYSSIEELEDAIMAKKNPPTNSGGIRALMEGGSPEFGGILKGPGTGTSDSIPGMIYQDGKPVHRAALSNNEFVFTEKLNYRLRGRSFALRIDSTSLGTKYKLGTPRVDIRQDGRR